MLVNDMPTGWSEQEGVMAGKDCAKCTNCTCGKKNAPKEPALVAMPRPEPGPHNEPDLEVWRLTGMGV